MTTCQNMTQKQLYTHKPLVKLAIELAGTNHRLQAFGKNSIKAKRCYT